MKRGSNSTNICGFQLLKYQDMLLFKVSYHCLVGNYFKGQQTFVNNANNELETF